MADLTASDVTVTVKAMANVQGGKPVKIHFAELSFGNGAKTYPTGGIPLPGIGEFGLKSRMDWISVVSTSTPDGFVWMIDQVNNKLLGYTQGVTVNAAGAGTLDDFPVSSGPGSSTISVGLAGGSAGTHRLGPLKELQGGVAAPAATKINVIAVGG